MKINYWENNQAEISAVLNSGHKELNITFDAIGALKDLPTVFRIPEHIFREHAENRGSQFFLNVDKDKEPIQWVIDIGERPL
jgi:hypothetical protein